MKSSTPDLPQKFRDLEAALRKERQALGASLIAELPLSATLLSRLRNDIDQLVKESSAQGTVEILELKCPMVLAVFLVSTAFAHYDDGEFWPHVGPLAAGQIAQGKLRSGLLLMLRRLGFETFQDVVMAEAAQRFVTPLLIHSCVPRAYIDSYFQKIVVPLALAPSRREQSDADLRAELLESEVNYMSRSVRRFIKYGGQFAMDFTRRCAELVEDALLDPTLVARDTKSLTTFARLPHWVVEEFQRWWPERDTKKSLTGPVKAMRWLRPHFVLDPFAPGGPALSLALPAQPVDEPHARWSWRVTLDGESHELLARTSWRGNQAWLVAGRVAITGPVSATAELLCDGKLVRKRVLEDLSAPVHFFDAQRGRLTEFTPQALWVLLQEGWQLQDPSRKVGSFVNPANGWSRHCLLEVDGDHRDGLVLTRPDGSSAAWHAALGRLGGKPVLPTALVRDDRDVPLYTGQLPRVTLAASLEDSSKWWLRLKAPGNRRIHLALDEVPLLATPEGRQVDLEALLGGAALAGDYAISLGGPLGSGWHAAFRFVPAFEVQTPALSDPDAAFTFELPAGLRATTGPGLVSAEPASGQVTLRLAPGAPEGTLVLEGANIRWTYRLRAPRPAWEASGLPMEVETAGARLEPFSWAVEDIVTAPYARVVLDAACWLAAVPAGELALELRDGPDGDVQHLPLEPRPRQAVDLDRLEWDQLRHPSARLVLVLSLAGRRVAEALVAYCRQGWQPQGVTLAAHARGDAQAVELVWEDARPLGYRAFELHALCRPWQPSLRLEVPDEASGRWRFEGCALTPGYYAIEPTLLDPWGESPPATLALGRPGVAYVWVGAPAERDEHLEKLSDGWMGTLERDLAFAWEQAPAGPPFPSRVMPPLQGDEEATAAWNWLLRARGVRAWKEFSAPLADRLSELPAARVLALAAAAPGSVPPERLAEILVEVGALAFPRAAYQALDEGQFAALAHAWPAAKWLRDPGAGPPLSEWSPWHEQQIRLYKDGRLEELERQFQMFCSDPDARQLCDIELFRRWAKDPRTFDGVRAWRTHAISKVPNHPLYRAMPQIAAAQLKRFERRDMPNPRENVPYLVLSIAYLLRANAFEGEPLPDVRALATLTHVHMPNLLALAASAWEDHLASTLTVRS